MGMTGDAAYALSKKLVIGLQSGLDHAYVDDINHTITFYWKAGGSTTMTFPAPKGYKSLDVKVIDGENHLIGVLDDDTEVDAGVIPTPSRVIHEQVITTASDTWHIQHNLNETWERLDILVLDDNKNIIIGELDETNSTNNLLVLKFNEPITGKAVIKK